MTAHNPSVGFGVDDRACAVTDRAYSGRAGLTQLSRWAKPRTIVIDPNKLEVVETVFSQCGLKQIDLEGHIVRRHVAVRAFLHLPRRIEQDAATRSYVRSLFSSRNSLSSLDTDAYDSRHADVLWALWRIG